MIITYFWGKINNDDVLALEIKDFDTACGSSAKPVTVRGEYKGVDNVTSLKRVEVLSFVKIPKHSDTILSTRCGKRTIWRYGDGVNVAGVTIVVGLEFAFGKFPNLITMC